MARTQSPLQEQLIRELDLHVLWITFLPFLSALIPARDPANFLFLNLGVLGLMFILGQGYISFKAWELASDRQRPDGRPRSKRYLLMNEAVLLAEVLVVLIVWFLAGQIG